jgi:peptidoglycan/LPS O-acetylase OafA/YrhL
MQTDRLHSLDALRAFALLLGIFFHGAAPYLQGFDFWLWHESPSATLGAYAFFSHVFRMALFFMIAGFFGRMVLERRGMRAFVKDRSKRILLPLVVGLPIILLTFGLLGWAGTTLRGGDFVALAAAQQTAAAPQPGAQPFFPWMHLWFLYYLVMFYVAALVLRVASDALLDRTGHIRRALDAVVRFVLAGVWGAALIGLPLAAYFSTLEGWAIGAGIPTPLALLPEVPTLVGYGTAFGFGWLAHRQMPQLLALERQWVAFLTLAAVLSVVAFYVAGGMTRNDTVLEGRELYFYCATYFVAMWCWVFGLTGAAIRFLSDDSPVRRYVADSSYWLYLMHLPVLAFFSGLLYQLPLHWSIKYSIQIFATLVVLFLSYRYLVRSTFIGAILNGRRYPRGVPGHSAAAATT